MNLATPRRAIDNRETKETEATGTRGLILAPLTDSMAPSFPMDFPALGKMGKLQGKKSNGNARRNTRARNQNEHNRDNDGPADDGSHGTSQGLRGPIEATKISKRGGRYLFGRVRGSVGPDSREAGYVGLIGGRA